MYAAGRYARGEVAAVHGLHVPGRIAEPPRDDDVVRAVELAVAPCDDLLRGERGGGERVRGSERASDSQTQRDSERTREAGDDLAHVVSELRHATAVEVAALVHDVRAVDGPGRVEIVLRRDVARARVQRDNLHRER